MTDQPRTSGRRAGPPRRRAISPRRGPGDPTALLAVLLLALAAALVILTPTAGPPPRPATTGGELVDRTVLACPDTSESTRGDAHVGLATGSGPLDGLGESGTVTIGPVGEAGDPQPVQRGELVETDTPSPVVDASGAVAAGLFAHRTDRTPGRSPATAVTPCLTPRASWWFAGAGATLDHDSELTLANLDPGPAVVDVRVFGPDGEVDTVGTRGITVAPGERTRIPMAEIAPQTEELLVHVQANRGRVAAAVVDRYAPDPGAEPGLEWLPAAERPRREVRIAGVPARGQEHTLLVGNPFDLEALVEVRVAGESGTFTPAGLDDVRVSPGTVESVDLDQLPREPVALQLRSRVPVVASVRSTRGADTSYAGSVRPLDAPAAATTVLPGRATVQLTAGEEPAGVRLTGYAADGQPTGEDRVTIDPTATATWRPPRGSDYAVVTPLQGQVHGATTYTRPGLASAPLISLPVRVTQPRVVPGP